MADYLIQDTTLDAIADAINAKTGGSSAMTPAEMVTAIGSISGGGGTDSVSGTFVIASGFSNNKTITHNLSSYNVAGLVWVEPDENDEIVANGYYEPLFLAAINCNDFINTKFNGVTLVTNYTSAETKTKLYSAVSTDVAKIQTSYRNANADFKTTFFQTALRLNVVDENNVTFSPDGSYFWAGVTFHWKIWELGV